MAGEGDVRRRTARTSDRVPDPVHRHDRRPGVVVTGGGLRRGRGLRRAEQRSGPGRRADAGRAADRRRRPSLPSHRGQAARCGHRARDSPPGVRHPQPRLRRPRLPRCVPAASVTGLGDAGAGHERPARHHDIPPAPHPDSRMGDPPGHRCRRRRPAAGRGVPRALRTVGATRDPAHRAALARRNGLTDDGACGLRVIAVRRPGRRRLPGPAGVHRDRQPQLGRHAAATGAAGTPAPTSPCRAAHRSSPRRAGPSRSTRARHGQARGWSRSSPGRTRSPPGTPTCRRSTSTPGSRSARVSSSARSGARGNATGCHLHFEVHLHNGSIYGPDNVDPSQWLAQNANAGRCAPLEG